MDLVGQTHLIQVDPVVDPVELETLDRLTLIVQELNPVNRELQEHTDTVKVVDKEVILTKVQAVAEPLTLEHLPLLLEVADLEEMEEQLLYQGHLILMEVAVLEVDGILLEVVDLAAAVILMLIVLLVQDRMVLAAAVAAADNLKEMEPVAEVVS